MKRLLALLLTVALLAGCTPTAVGPNGPVAVSPPVVSAVETVTPAPEANNPWMEDYDDFWRVVEENYALYAAAEHITGKNFETVKEDLRLLVEEIEGSGGLYTAIHKAAQSFEYTGHLQMIDKRWYATVMGVYRNAGEAKCDYLFERINSPRSREFYDYREPEETVGGSGVQSAGEQSISRNGEPDFQRPSRAERRLCGNSHHEQYR